MMARHIIIVKITNVKYDLSQKGYGIVTPIGLDVCLNTTKILRYKLCFSSIMDNIKGVP